MQKCQLSAYGFSCLSFLDLLVILKTMGCVCEKMIREGGRERKGEREREREGGREVGRERGRERGGERAVSYTHLTLPTRRTV